MQHRSRPRVPCGLARLLGASLVVCTAACGPGVGTINGKPDHYYGRRISFSGYLGDVLVQTDSGDPEVFHLVARHGHRIIVAAASPVRYRFGDRIHVRGEFVPETTVSGRSFYDVVAATEVVGFRRLGWLPFR